MHVPLEIRGQLPRVGFCLLQCGFHGWNSNPQACQQAPLANESKLVLFLNFLSAIASVLVPFYNI